MRLDQIPEGTELTDEQWLAVEVPLAKGAAERMERAALERALILQTGEHERLAANRAHGHAECQMERAREMRDGPVYIHFCCPMCGRAWKMRQDPRRPNDPFDLIYRCTGTGLRGTPT